MKRTISKKIFALFFAAVTIIAFCLPVQAAVERQSVHIKTPGISVEIPGDAVYNVKEADTGELLTASDPDSTYTFTLESEKSDSIFTYKDLTKAELDETQNDIQSEQNADKVTTYETSQAVFFDCINNTDKYLLSTTIVNGYKYTLKLAVGKRQLTISDHGIFNTAARSIVFDSIENKPVEVNVLGTIGTIVCVAVAVIVIIAIVFVLVRSIRKKLPEKKTAKKKIPESVNREKAGIPARSDNAKRETAFTEQPKEEIIKAAEFKKPQSIKPKRKNTRADSAAESFYNEMASDGLFDEQAAEEIPAQVQLDFIENQPGDENFENNPVRMRVDIIKPVSDGEDAQDFDLYELSRSNNEDYDEAVSDDEYPQDDSFSSSVKGIFGKNRNDNADDSGNINHRAKKTEAKPAVSRQRVQRTEEERQRAAQRRAQRQANRPEHKSSYSDSEFVKSFDDDSYWDKYR